MLKFCVTCGTALVEGARFCVECGTPRPEDSAIPEQTRARDLLVSLVEKTMVREIVKPETYGVPEFEALLAAGDYGQGTTDFDTFFNARPSLTVTAIIASPDLLPDLYDKFLGACGQNLIGTIELDEGVLFVSAPYEREDGLPTGVEQIAAATGGSATVLIGGPTEEVSQNYTFMASEDIVGVFSDADLVSIFGRTPERYELKDQVESSVFKFCPERGNQDKVLLVSVYLGVAAKGMFGFEESQNQAILSDENWTIEFSSNFLTPSEFAQVIAKYKDEVGGEFRA